MTRFPTRRLLALALAAGLSVPALALAAEPFVASDIRVDGLQRISSGTVFTYLPVNRGDTVDDAKVGEAIRALYKTGFFEDVQLDRQGSILVVTVKERPAINKLTVTGNKDIKSEELLKGLSDIGLTEGGTFDRLSLDRVTQELTRQYNNRGKYGVQITPSVERLDRNRINLTINVKEGKAAKIRHINLIGNETFEEEVMKFCRHLAKQNGEQMGAAKIAIELAYEVGRDQARHVERLANSALMLNPDYLEGMKKYVQGIGKGGKG